MLPFTLSSEVKVSVLMNAVAAGTSNQTSSALDMLGYDSALFIVSIGTLTASQVTSAKLQQSSDDAAADAYDDLTGTSSGAMADGDSNKLILIDIHKPAKRYLKCLVLRGTANAVINGIVAVQYNGRSVPITQPTSVFGVERFLSPAEGTA